MQSIKFLLLVFLSLLIYGCNPASQKPRLGNMIIDKTQISTMFKDGVLQVKIPMQKQVIGAINGRLKLEVINLDDETIAQKEKRRFANTI